MGVLIRGMEMPKNCFTCPFKNLEICDEDCPLVEVPSADVVEVKHGKWIVLDDRWEFEEVKCSNCGCVEYFNKGWKKFNYCPTCGATMDMGGE